MGSRRRRGCLSGGAVHLSGDGQSVHCYSPEALERLLQRSPPVPCGPQQKPMTVLAPQPRPRAGARSPQFQRAGHVDADCTKCSLVQSPLCSPARDLPRLGHQIVFIQPLIVTLSGTEKASSGSSSDMSGCGTSFGPYYTMLVCAFWRGKSRAREAYGLWAWYCPAKPVTAHLGTRHCRAPRVGRKVALPQRDAGGEAGQRSTPANWLGTATHGLPFAQRT